MRRVLLLACLFFAWAARPGAAQGRAPARSVMATWSSRGSATAVVLWQPRGLLVMSAASHDMTTRATTLEAAAGHRLLRSRRFTLGAATGAAHKPGLWTARGYLLPSVNLGRVRAFSTMTVSVPLHAAGRRSVGATSVVAVDAGLPVRVGLVHRVSRRAGATPRGSIGSALRMRVPAGMMTAMVLYEPARRTTEWRLEMRSTF